MSFFLYLLVGIVGGIPGGMGMGGGTLLIPILSIFVPQRKAQLINLLSFLPMATFSLLRYKKEGLLDGKGYLPLIVPALIGSVCGSLFSLFLNGEMLKKGFGIFLIVLGVIQFTFRQKSGKIEA